jgi:hypothetical protein
MLAHFLWWSCPGAMALGAAIAGMSFSVPLVGVSVCATVLISAETLLSRRVGRELRPDAISASLLGCLLWCLAPFAVAVAVARSTVGLAQVSGHVPWVWIAALAGCAAAGSQLWGAARGAVEMDWVGRQFVVLPQCLAPLFLLALLPTRLRLPDGSISAYPVEPALTVLAWILAVASVARCVSGLRRRRSIAPTGDRSGWGMSPLAVLALVLVGIFGKTGAPVVSGDDYHYGETLLGWMSYRGGHLPYVDYQPPHGFVQDDLAALLTSVFFDGSAAAHTEALRLTASLLTALLFAVVWWATRSQLLTVVATVIGVAPTAVGFSGTSWVFLCAVGWFLVAPRLRAKPRLWIVAWVLLAPVLVLAVPAQGLALVGASGVLAVRSVLQVLREEGIRGLAAPAGAVAGVALVSAVTPLGRMLAGAVGYVTSNAPVNLVAYGIPWNPALSGRGDTPIGLDVLRMLWAMGLVLCCITAVRALRTRQWHGEALARAGFFALFLGGVLPYVMGRIDAGVASRPGQATAFTLALVVPALVWWDLRSRGRAILAVGMVACVSALFGPVLQVGRLTAAAEPFVTSKTLVDGSTVGLPGWGRAAPQDPKSLEQTERLARILRRELPPGAPYYDATSHNAQYYYLGRRPAVSVPAVYNLPLLADQRRTIRQLTRASPEIAVLLEPLGNLTHDGGGLALRTPLLARYLERTYTPYQQDGFILGHLGAHIPRDADLSVSLALADDSDGTWDRGVSSTSAAIKLADPTAATMIRVGASVTLPDGSQRKVTAAGAGVLTLAGPEIEAGVGSEDHDISVDVSDLDQRLYHAWLFERAFGQSDLRLLPSSWGRSLNVMNGLDLVARVRGTSRLEPGSPPMVVPLPPVAVGSAEFDMVALDVRCMGNDTGSPVISLSWTSPSLSPEELPGRIFVAKPGAQLVPLDSSAFWQSTDAAEALVVRFAEGGGCEEARISHVSLWKRSG